MSKHKYKFARRIAVGGMAEVLLARQQGLAGFEKLVVVKRILPQLRDDGRFVEMFLNEARLAASLRHPNIVEIYDVVRDHDDFFIVMEYLSGEDARTILRRARREDFAVPVGVACRVVADAASGLEYAHTSVGRDGKPLGIVHRDVGPTNLLVTYTGVTKLLDFGLAKANVHNIYTKPGTLKGKYGYASPEQVQHQELDARSDVFSLAVVLWELLTVRRLFSGRTPAEVLQAVMERRVPPPSAFNPLVPRELDEVVAAALQRDRDRRTASAQALCAQLEQVLEKLRLHAGKHQVGSWMQTALAEHYDERREVEQAVVAGTEGGELEGEVAEIPSAFQNLRSSASPRPSVTPPDLAADLVDSSQISSHVSSHVSHFSRISPLEGVDRSVGVRVDTVPVPDRSRGLLWIVLAVLLLSMVGVAFLFGRVMSDPSRSTAASTGSLQPPVGSKVAFLLRVNPPGAQLDVDGRPFDQQVGPDGVLVEAPPDRDVELVVKKTGYRTAVRRVRSPEQGTFNVYLNLRPDQARALRSPELARTSTSAVGPSGGRPPGAEPGNGVRRAGRAAIARARRRHARRRGGRSSSARPVAPSVSIVTDPPGALVEVDGRLAGRTPLSDLRLEPERAYRVVARLPGFEAWSETVRLPADRERTFDVTLKPVQVAPEPAVASRSGTGAGATATAPVRVARDRVGDVAVGARLFEDRCRTCHGQTASNVEPRDKTVRQWISFFAYGKHRRHVPLRGVLTVSELADIKAYLMKNAFDVESDTAAGIR